MKTALLLIIAAPFFASAAALADEIPAEIEYLLTTIGSSDCVFVRNGKRHDAQGAEDHLRMKYRRGNRYASTTEAFIERLASRSSMSKKLYHIECPGAEPVPSGEWLSQRLAEYRDNRDDR